MAKRVPLILRHRGRSHVHGHRGTPLIRRQASGRKLTNHSLQPHSHHLGKTHLTLRRNPLGLPKKVIGNLYLRFYHDGNLPTSVCLSNAIQKKISPTCCARKGVCPTYSHIKRYRRRLGTCAPTEWGGYNFALLGGSAGGFGLGETAHSRLRLGTTRRAPLRISIRAHLLAFAGCSQTAEDCRCYNRTDFLRGASSVRHLNPGNPPSGKSANTRRFRG